MYADDQVLRGVTLALKKVDKEAKKEWAKAMRTTGTRVWRSTIRNRKSRPQDQIFGAASVRWSQGGKGVAVVRTKPLSGGWPGALVVDFGDKDGRYGRTSGRAPFPRYESTGRVVYGALDPFGQWMGAMSLRTLADSIREAANMET